MARKQCFVGVLNPYQMYKVWTYCTYAINNSNSTFRAKALPLLIPDKGPSLETSKSCLLPR